MDNFYTEHEGYKKLQKKLINLDPFLAMDLNCVVGDAIQYGISKLEEIVTGTKKEGIKP